MALHVSLAEDIKVLSRIDFLYYYYANVQDTLSQGTSVHFVKPLSSLTDQCKNPGADYTGVQKPSNKRLLAYPKVL